MTTKLAKEFDIQDYLINTEKDPKAFFKACIEEDPGDGSLVRRALGELAKAKGMTQSLRRRVSRDSVCTKHSVPKDLQNSKRYSGSAKL